jgi:hypothetical protein
MGELWLQIAPMAPFVAVFFTLFLFRGEGFRAEAIIPAATAARATLLQWEETHRALTQAVVDE